MNERFVQVKGHDNLVRDTQSNAIINKNRNAYDIAKKEQRMHKDKEMKLEMQQER